uniref:Uncharacterized protein n=1 Tax=Anguilla anguilla TaxID=7936 RepID=A0A0E9PIV1_ANGAN
MNLHSLLFSFIGAFRTPHQPRCRQNFMHSVQHLASCFYLFHFCHRQFRSNV